MYLLSIPIWCIIQFFSSQGVSLWKRTKNPKTQFREYNTACYTKCGNRWYRNSICLERSRGVAECQKLSNLPAKLDGNRQKTIREVTQEISWVGVIRPASQLHNGCQLLGLLSPSGKKSPSFIWNPNQNYRVLLLVASRGKEQLDRIPCGHLYLHGVTSLEIENLCGFVGFWGCFLL